MKATYIAALSVVVIALLAAAFLVNTQMGASTTSTESQSSTTVASSTTVVTGGSETNASASLQLRLAVNASSTGGPSGGVTVRIAVDEYNTLASANNVSSATQWGLPDLSLGSCGYGAYPFGVALYIGAYTAGNVSTATPLRIYPITPCPELVRLVTGYLFQPTSDLAVILPGSTNAATPMSANVTATAEYASGSSLSSTPLGPGAYTAVAGDEWGSVVFIQFSIGVGGATTITSATAASTGTLGASFSIGPVTPLCTASASIGPAPQQYSSIGLVVTSSSSGQVTTLPISWVSNGCEVSGVVQAALAPGEYSLNLSSCTFLGCSSALPKIFEIVAGQSASVSVSIDTGLA